MKLLFDARKLGDGGIGRYIENLLDGFYKVEDLLVTVITPPNPELKPIWQNKYSFIESKIKKYSLSEMFSGGGKGFDIFHIPHYTLPYFTKCITVITVHDLIHIQHPEKFYYPYIAKPLIKSAVQRADRVITVSNYSKEMLIKYFPEQENKITFIPNAISEEIVSSKKKNNSINENDGQFLFAVLSNSKPHKAPEDLIKAYEIISLKLKDLPKLLIAGRGGRGLNIPSSLKDKIIILGEIDNESLTRFYENAIALVIPSLLEGFCLQMLEAHANGTRCVVRPIRPLDELVTDYDYVAKDLRIESLAEAMINALKETKIISEKLKDETLNNYSVERITNQTVEVYRAVMERRAPARLFEAHQRS